MSHKTLFKKGGKMKVIKVGMVCCYCGTQTQDACCGEVHHETGYVEVVVRNPKTGKEKIIVIPSLQNLSEE